MDGQRPSSIQPGMAQGSKTESGPAQKERVKMTDRNGGPSRKAPLPWQALARLLEDNGPTKRERIAEYLGITVRMVRKTAQEARKRGVPIGYSTDRKRGGLYICKDPVELRRAIKKIRGLALTLLGERRSLQQSLTHMENRPLPYQPTLGF